MMRWQAGLVDQLGGIDNLTPSQLEILELASRQKILVSALDSILLLMKAPVNRRNLSLFPIVGQRGQEADRLVRYLQLLGLERRAKPLPVLSEYIEEKYNGNKSGSEPESENQEQEAARQASLPENPPAPAPGGESSPDPARFSAPQEAAQG
jgi:hypothetical protein